MPSQQHLAPSLAREASGDIQEFIQAPPPKKRHEDKLVMYTRQTGKGSDDTSEIKNYIRYTINHDSLTSAGASTVATSDFSGCLSRSSVCFFSLTIAATVAPAAATPAAATPAATAAFVV